MDVRVPTGGTPCESTTCRTNNIYGFTISVYKYQLYGKRIITRSKGEYLKLTSNRTESNQSGPARNVPASTFKVLRTKLSVTETLFEPSSGQLWVCHRVLFAKVCRSGSRIMVFTEELWEGRVDTNTMTHCHTEIPPAPPATAAVIHKERRCGRGLSRVLLFDFLS